MRRYFILLIPALLAGCGTLSQPFLGRPGPEGAMLSVPPPPVLIVPPPHDALLGDAAAHRYAADLAAALVVQDVPSLARPAAKFDWRLIASARMSAAKVLPAFAIVGPTGRTYGRATGAPVAAAQWADGDPATLKQAALAAAPSLAHQLAAINANIQQSNPLSLENRPTRVQLVGVTGAPGDGDHALALDLRRSLSQLGVMMVHRKPQADFLVTGVVKVSPPRPAAADHSEIVELDWTVKSQSGQFIGKVSQLHNLKRAQMAPYWGDVAVAAAQQAALGLKQVIVNAIPKRVAARSGSVSKRPAPARSAKSPEP